MEEQQNKLVNWLRTRVRDLEKEKKEHQARKISTRSVAVLANCPGEMEEQIKALMKSEKILKK